VAQARRRLDAELVHRGLARSREQARDLVEDGRVVLGGVVATKPATQVDAGASIRVEEAADGPDYVSRGAHKLVGALDAFGLDVAGRHALDAGASTGGFCDVLLRRGVAAVVAVDVGYGQLAWPIRSDDRVTVLERTNVRDLTADLLPFAPDLVVGDLSFISLRLVLPPLAAVATADADLPQFEVGRAAVGDGVVRDPALRRSAVRGVADAALGLGLSVRGVAASPLPGPSGNVEYFLWLSADGTGMMGSAPAGLAGARLDDEIARAVTEGPP